MIDRTIWLEKLEKSGAKKEVGLMARLDGGLGTEEKSKSQKRKQLILQVGGGRRFVMRRDGHALILSHEKEDQLTWRWKQRRRKLMERWEASPPGPQARRMIVREQKRDSESNNR